MAELGPGVFANIILNRLPIAVVIPNSMAVAANREDCPQLRQFRHAASDRGFLGRNPVCNIDTTANKTAEFAVSVEWHTPVKDPAIRSIVTLKPVLHLKNPSLGKRYEISFQAPVVVVRVYPFSPSVPVFLFQSSPTKLKPATIEIVAAT